MPKSWKSGSEDYWSSSDFGRVAALSQQGRDGLTAPGVDKVRRYFGQRRENKFPLDQSRVRNSQPVFMNNVIPVKQDVDIQSSGGSASTSNAFVLPFHKQAGVQNLAGRQARFSFYDCIEKPRLIPDVFRFGFINRRGSNRFDTLFSKAWKRLP